MFHVPSSTYLSSVYFIIGNIGKYFDGYDRIWIKMKNRNIEKSDLKVIHKRISWNDAAEICKSINAYLPHFTSRDELDEFLMLIKTSMDLPIMEAVFIGLRHYENGVSGCACFGATTSIFSEN